MNECMKNEIINVILQTEKQSIGHRVSYNSVAYYRSFENLYNSDPTAFSAAVSALKNNEYLLYDTTQFSYFCNERILVHLLRISAYFGIECASLQAQLKFVFQRAMSLLKESDYRASESGRRLFQAAEDFLKVIGNGDQAKERQLFYKDIPTVLPTFRDFISLKEVNDLHSAVLYEFCAKLKLVPAVPDYIENAMNAGFVIDCLYGTVLWEHYLKHHSYAKIEKDVVLLQKVGFVSIPQLLSQIMENMRADESSYQTAKMRLCEKMCKKYGSQIKHCMDQEKSIIDDYLVFMQTI